MGRCIELTSFLLSFLFFFHRYAETIEESDGTLSDALCLLARYLENEQVAERVQAAFKSGSFLHTTGQQAASGGQGGQGVEGAHVDQMEGGGGAGAMGGMGGMDKLGIPPTPQGGRSLTGSDDHSFETLPPLTMMDRLRSTGGAFAGTPRQHSVHSSGRSADGGGGGSGGRGGSSERGTREAVDFDLRLHSTDSVNSSFDRSPGRGMSGMKKRRSR